MGADHDAVMRIFRVIWFVLLASEVLPQQVPMYTQYTFNRAGLNPAASGLDINQEYNYVIGLNKQWVGFENAPRNNFLNVSYTIRPLRAYKYWQNAGFYFDQENSGLTGSTGLYGSYTFHMLLRKKTVLSFGVFGGARQYERSAFAFDPNDPAVKNSRSTLWVYPDIIPGFRITSKKFWAGIALRQVTTPSLKNFKGRKIGSPSKLKPNIYLEYGRNIELSEFVLMMPSVAINLPVLAPPTIDGSLLFYFVNRVGAGVSIRNASFASGILQVRFLKSMTAGFAYSYPVNASRYVAQNSYEFMLGITPQGMNTKLIGSTSVARCPTLSY